MTIKGTIETKIIGSINQNADWYGCSDTFVALYNFFNGLGAIGVTRVAYNRGSGGTGMTYWDQGAPPGNCAWALFRFGNAQIPFYVLLQSCNVNRRYTYTFSSFAGCTPCVCTGSDGNIGTGYFVNCAITFAMRLDGGSPWNGTTVNTGTDTKGTPVWTPGASTLAVWPRCNSTGGDRATNRDAVSLLTSCNWINNANSIYDAYYYAGRIQMLADENNVLLLFDAGSASANSYAVTYFGKYVPRPGVNPQIPYVMLNTVNPVDPVFRAGYTYGTTGYQGMDWTNAYDGGIVHPTASLGVKSVRIDYLDTLRNPRFYPSHAVANTKLRPGRHESWPLFLLMYEAPYYGLMGTVDFFRLIYGVSPMATTPDKRLACIGGWDTLYSTKLLIPWDGDTVPGTGINRVGLSF